MKEGKKHTNKQANKQKCNVIFVYFTEAKQQWHMWNSVLFLCRHRHHGLNASIREISCCIPGYDEANKETKVISSVPHRQSNMF